ncbi:MAG: hypothetical protein QMC80_03295 [Thermoplasmatales archaeon]|nr:hypothetical protein [Thermoplasmatales archaeon]
MKDNEGQLLLLAVVFLAVTLIVIASAATVFLNVKQNQINGSLAVEYGNVKEKFGIALNESANKTYKDKYSYNPSYNITAINDGFNKTRDAFGILLSYRGINFEAVLDRNSVTNVGQKYNVPVNITMMREGEHISESVNYTVVL